MLHRAPLENPRRISAEISALNALQGMKRLGYLAGAYLGYPTTYLHEDQQRLHIIPSVPIQIDDEVLKGLAPLIRRVAWASPSLQSFKLGERQLMEEHPHLFYEFEPGYMGLSSFGEFLRERPELRPFIGSQIYVASDQRPICKRKASLLGELIAYKREVDGGILKGKPSAWSDLSELLSAP